MELDLNWAEVKELTLNDYRKETPLFTVYPYYGNFATR